MNATGGVHQWTALHLAAHGGHLSIVRELLQAGADIFSRNQNNQLPRHCAKGNYILTKFIKMAEHACSSKIMIAQPVKNQFQLIRGLQLKKASRSVSADTKASQKGGTRGYKNFVSTLKLLRKHRPFAEADNLPKVCQPEDHGDLQSPGTITSSSSQSNSIISDGSFNTGDVKRQAIASNSPTKNNIPKSARSIQAASKNESIDFNGGVNLADTTKRPDIIGPSFKLNALNNPNKQLIDPSERFRKLNQMAEDKKINLFYLRDQLLRTKTDKNGKNSQERALPLSDRLNALAKIKRNVLLPIFKFAVEPILRPDTFVTLGDLCIQIDLVQAVGRSQQPELLKDLQKLLACRGRGLHPDVSDEIHEAINDLKAFQEEQAQEKLIQDNIKATSVQKLSETRVIKPQPHSNQITPNQKKKGGMRVEQKGLQLEKRSSSDVAVNNSPPVQVAKFMPNEQVKKKSSRSQYQAWGPGEEAPAHLQSTKPVRTASQQRPKETAAQAHPAPVPTLKLEKIPSSTGRAGLAKSARGSDPEEKSDQRLFTAQIKLTQPARNTNSPGPQESKTIAVGEKIRTAYVPKQKMAQTSSQRLPFNAPAKQKVRRSSRSKNRLSVVNIPQQQAPVPATVIVLGGAGTRSATKFQGAKGEVGVGGKRPPYSAKYYNNV